MTQAIERHADNGTALARVSNDDELTVQEIVAQVSKIQEVMQAIMKRDEHYGVIPGTGTKPTLLKAGAEKLCLLFRLGPQYEITETREGQHLTVLSRCTLIHTPSGQARGSGLGSCSTKESKYAWRQGGRKCPNCDKETIIKGKAEYGGGWLCFGKKGGCGAKFKAGDKAIEAQETGRKPNEDIADTYNTVLKMANKRSLVAAVLNVTAASDIFTQDLEDLPQFAPVDAAPAVDWHTEITACESLDELRAVWERIPAADRKRNGLAAHKNNKKKMLDDGAARDAASAEADASEAEAEIINAQFDDA
jgi:hypothetical protein